jgi:hypothetical protein
VDPEVAGSIPANGTIGLPAKALDLLENFGVLIVDLAANSYFVLPIVIQMVVSETWEDDANSMILTASCN